ncbi:MAG: PAS domain S-box protein [Anaerolineae bacterium]|nr:PAS domain S-box protein [Anaerolineae bacterium]
MNRILLLLDHKENRRLLAEWLGQQYQVILADTDQALDQPFDLGILDGPALDRLWERVQARKEAEQPLFLPFLLVTARKDVRYVTRHLWRTVDELILTPLEKVELQARVEVLLRARQLSLELHQRYRRLFENVPLGLYRTTPNGRILDANAALVQMLGYPNREALMAIKSTDTYVDPQDRERWRELMERQGAVSHFEVQLRRRDGSIMWVENSAQVVRDAEGLVLYYEGSLQDITERKRAEEARAHSQRLLLALSQAAQAVQRARTPEEVYRTIGDEVARLGYHAAVFTLTADRTHLTPSYLSYEPAVIRAAEKLVGLSAKGYRFPLVPGGLYQRVIAEGKAVFSEPTLEFVTEALPTPLRPLAGRLAALLGMQQSIIAPLVVGGETYGLLAVTGTSLSEADVPAVSTFARQAAIALESAQLFLSLTERQAELRALAIRLAEVEEDERRRLARELHDRVGQNLTALGINLNVLGSQLPPETAAQMRARLADCLTLVEETTGHIRDVMAELRPAVLDDYGLLAALHWYGQRFSQRTGIATMVQGQEPAPRLPPAVETALFRIVQEALTNVAKHAQARQVTVTLEPVDGGARLSIADDGVGFDPTVRRRAGWGLMTMRERAQAVGGHLRVDSAPGKGTRVVVEVPK